MSGKWAIHASRLHRARMMSVPNICSLVHSPDVRDAFLIAAGQTDRIAASSVRAARMSLVAALHSLDKFTDEVG
jgi:hypothetical protein